ncbi:MAG: glycoside hydrolase family 5 protein [Pelomonas sp.]|nr:glycoside hydrolase family 5 protein [Roseateles sp.]
MRIHTPLFLFVTGLLAAAAHAQPACTASRLTTNLAVSGSAASAPATVAAGTPLQLSARVDDTGGRASWRGCGLSSTATRVNFTAKASCTATVTYTNACGQASSASFAITVPGMRDLTSVQLSRLMGAGWNLGNTLEATGGETAWGNPPASQALFNAVRAAGFKTVRIPVSWKQYADASDTISPAWMARVTQVVNQARNAGLYVMINIHWDGGWMIPDYAHQAEVNARLTKFWTQIANNFKSHDDMLLFAGSNEVAMPNNFDPPTAENAAVQNGFNQTFIDAVRATGGNNLARHLVVQSYGTGVDNAINVSVLPNDPVASRLMMEVHFYDPYFFTLATTYWDGTPDKYWQWGRIVTDAAASPEHWADEAYVESQFRRLKTAYVDRGVPVIVGEYGAISRLSKDAAGLYRTYWDEFVARTAWANGAVPVYWDEGALGDHSMGLFNRRTTLQAYPKTIKAIVNAAR